MTIGEKQGWHFRRSGQYERSVGTLEYLSVERMKHGWIWRRIKDGRVRDRGETPYSSARVAQAAADAAWERV